MSITQFHGVMLVSESNADLVSCNDFFNDIFPKLVFSHDTFASNLDPSPPLTTAAPQMTITTSRYLVEL